MEKFEVKKSIQRTLYNHGIEFCSGYDVDSGEERIAVYIWEMEKFVGRGNLRKITGLPNVRFEFSGDGTICYIFF